MSKFSQLAQVCGGQDLHPFSQEEYLQSFSSKGAEAFADAKYGEKAIEKFYKPRNMVGGWGEGGVCRALSVAYILSHRLNRRPNPHFGQKTYFQAFTNNAGQHPDNHGMARFLKICRAQLKFAAEHGKADENSGLLSARENVAAVCPTELDYASDRWVVNGTYGGVGINPLVTPGYWLISAGCHMTALVVEPGGNSWYFDPNEGDVHFPNGASAFIAQWFQKKRWGQTRFIQFVDR